ncbi:MAG: C40 family peptidase [Lachnospiraceae bacterium]
MKIKIKKKQWVSAGLMLIISIGPIAASYWYTPITAVTLATPPLPTAGRQRLDTSDAVTAALSDAIEEETWEPAPGYLNLTRYFPEGADTSKVEESYAGEAFKVLMDKDAEWLDNIYEYADLTPTQLSNRLGRSGGSVTGKYNPKDNRHDVTDPSTWTINSFKKIRMNVTNGDGQTVNAYTNVIDIMSMANLYTYFKGIDDNELFLSYAESLWDSSHSYSVSMSGIYYCQGCLSEEDELRELAELEAEALAEEQALKQPEESTSVDSEAKDTQNDTKAAATESSSASAVIEAGTTAREPETTTAAAETQATQPESTSGVITSGRGQTQAAEEAAIETSTGAETTDKTTLAEATAETPAESDSDSVSADLTASPANVSTEQTTGEQDDPTSVPAYKCPGHIDLIINAKILGLNENNGLLAKDIIGNITENFEEDGWQGWTNYTIASVKLHSSQDWYDKYGLTVSTFSMKNPLTEAEIEEYLQRISKDLSPERLELVRFALSSVGKVPYYWGGKPSGPDYAANSFGLMVSPDYKGRILKGLDCSGWISWVYWSVTGERLAHEGTSGLALVGTKVSRSELKPGDIIIRTGTDAHVIMFLGWTDDGRILCIHESSGKTNNVTIAVRDANWPYYRSLLD